LLCASVFLLLRLSLGGGVGARYVAGAGKTPLTGNRCPGNGTVSIRSIPSCRNSTSWAAVIVHSQVSGVLRGRLEAKADGEKSPTFGFPSGSRADRKRTRVTPPLRISVPRGWLVA